MDSDEDNDNVWGAVSADSGLACVDGRGDDDAAESVEDVYDLFDLARVYGAVENGASLDALRAVIRDVGRESSKRRARAVNHEVHKPMRVERGVFVGGGPATTALKLAHAKGAWHVAGALLVAGADPKQVFDGRFTSLAACAAYGYADGVRALLRAGKDARERMDKGMTAAHAALDSQVFGRYHPPRPDNAGQLACVAALVREGGGEGEPLLELRDDGGATPLLKLALWPTYGISMAAALRTLVGDLGADVNAKNARTGRTLLYSHARHNAGGMLHALLTQYGASADVADAQGVTPLMVACTSETSYSMWAYSSQSSSEAVELLLPASSQETRRAVRRSDNKSAADLLLEYARRIHPPPPPMLPAAAAGGGPPPPPPLPPLPPPEWVRQAIAELVASGAPVQPEFQAYAREIGVMPPPVEEDEVEGGAAAGGGR
jgi:ankyrin repeat protein